VRGKLRPQSLAPKKAAAARLAEPEYHQACTEEQRLDLSRVRAELWFVV